MLLTGPDVAPRLGLADAIDEQGRKVRGAKLTLVPVDARDCQGHDAPAVVRTLPERLHNPGRVTEPSRPLLRIP